MAEKEINSIQDLLRVLSEDNADYLGSTWYRGQSSFEWSLLPGYMRLRNPLSESTLMQRFKQSAAMLVNTHPREAFDWLFLMQHYGVPTRLLDWSESPLVALYFAVQDMNTDVDATLWLLRPSELNKNARINNPHEEFFIPSFEDEELESYTVKSLSQNPRLKLLPIATIATRNNTRIQAQHGVFTIHHIEAIPIEAVGDASHVIKYKIPAKSKSVISNQLSLLGFSKFQLFPELASIGEIIKGVLL